MTLSLSLSLSLSMYSTPHRAGLQGGTTMAESTATVDHQKHVKDKGMIPSFILSSTVVESSKITSMDAALLHSLDKNNMKKKKRGVTRPNS
jgi:hypothetical protein